MKYVILFIFFGMANVFGSEPATERFAELKKIEHIDQKHSILTISFVMIFNKRSGGKYRKLLQPSEGEQITPKKDFEANIHNELIIRRASKRKTEFENRKLREFTKNSETKFEAYCLESPFANKDGLVSLSFPEFMIIASENKKDTEEGKAVYEKYGKCYSTKGGDLINAAYEGGALINVEYDRNILKRVTLMWFP